MFVPFCLVNIRGKSFKGSIFVCFLLLSSWQMMAQLDADLDRISPVLVAQMATSTDYLEAVIELEDQVDVNSLAASFRAENLPQNQRVPFLIHQLQQKASNTQGPLLAFLAAQRGVDHGSIQAFWIGNLIYFRGGAATIVALSQRSDVRTIHHYEEPQPSEHVRGGFAMPAPNGHEIGHDLINAPAMWALGYTGQGTKILVIDTGTDATHPALKDNYLGNFRPNAQANWNPGNSTAIPEDCDSHGTHVTGTACGLNRSTNDTIGVAFNAYWMAAPAIRPQGPGEGCDGVGGPNVLSTLQWAINPDGNANTTEDMPSVINNSYGSSNPSSCNYFAKSAVDALEAAGVALVYAAGNDTFPESIGSPAHLNTSLVNTFSVGAVRENNLQIATFSSQGPSICGGVGSLLIKPEVSAPGNSTRSAIPGGGYAFFGGTSMAAPHVAGAVALLKEAFPQLDGEQLKLALYFTAVDLGPVGEDNTYGMGIIDVLAAYQYLLNQGHTAFQPPVDRDAALINLDPGLDCGLSNTPVVTLANKGKGPITSLKIAFSYSDGTQGDTLWTGSLSPGQTTTFTLPTHETQSSGAFTFRAEIVEENGQAAYYLLDNALTTDFVLLEGVDLATIPTNACLGYTGLLRAVSTTSGAVSTWYDVATGGNALFRGNAFVTPAMTSSKIFYVAPGKQIATGPVLIPGSPGLINPIAGDYLEFDASYPFLLRKVSVIAGQAGERTIQLRTSTGGILQTKKVNLSAGLQEVELDFAIPIGENFRLGLSGTSLASLFTSYTNFQFPYEVPGIMTLKGSSTGFYHFFFDWEILWELPCPRVPAFLTVSTGAIDASFTASDTLTTTGTPITFTSTTTNATSWLWDFGDGETSTSASPSHSWTLPGTYQVSMQATNAAFCGDATATTVTVLQGATISIDQPLARSLKVYPNPVSESMWIEWELETLQQVSLRLITVQGQVVKQWERHSSVNKEEISMQGLPTGMYFLQVNLEDESLSYPVLKAEE